MSRHEATVAAFHGRAIVRSFLAPTTPHHAFHFGRFRSCCFRSWRFWDPQIQKLRRLTLPEMWKLASPLKHILFEIITVFVNPRENVGSVVVAPRRLVFMYLLRQLQFLSLESRTTAWVAERRNRSSGLARRMGFSRLVDLPELLHLAQISSTVYCLHLVALNSHAVEQMVRPAFNCVPV